MDTPLCKDLILSVRTEQIFNIENYAEFFPPTVSLQAFFQVFFLQIYESEDEGLPDRRGCPYW